MPDTIPPKPLKDVLPRLLVELDTEDDDKLANVFISFLSTYGLWSAHVSA